MANLQKWKKWMAVGCSHGSLVDPAAVEAVLKFRRAYKPERRFHLGDVFDFTAFRGGALGTKDEAVQLEPDIEAGIRFIHQYQPTDLLIGNHDERVWQRANHPNAVIARAAMSCRNEFLTACEKVHVKHLVDHYDVNRSYLELGDYKVLHGWWYNDNSLRDHAETYGNVIMAQLHTPGQVRGRRVDKPTGFCVGMLGDARKFDYALRRRATLRWALGFCWGETDGKKTIVRLEQCETGNAKNWHLPL